MNKKGFTLVELLAVIAILAILVIIALPNVLGMFNNAKKSTFNTETQNIFKQAQTDFVQDSITAAGAQIYCQDNSYATLCPKDSDGKKIGKALNLESTKAYYVAVTANGTITNIVVVDGSFAYGNKNTAGIKVTDIKENDAKDIDSQKGKLTGDTFDVTNYTTVTVDED